MSNAGAVLESFGTLRILIEPEEEGGRLSLYHVGQGLAITQRMINRAMDEDGEDFPELGLFSKEQRREAFQLGFREITFGSIDLIAVINYSYIHGLLPFMAEAATQVFAGVVTAILVKVARVNEGENPFKSDDPIRPSLEDLAATVDAGHIVFGLQMGQFTCAINRRTQERLKELNRQELSGAEVSEIGTVVGSSLEDHCIYLHIDSHDRKIPCYYHEHESRDFERFTQLRTKVKIIGIPIWRGVKEITGPPSYIRLRLIQRYSPHPTSSP